MKFINVHPNQLLLVTIVTLCWHCATSERQIENKFDNLCKASYVLCIPLLRPNVCRRKRRFVLIQLDSDQKAFFMLVCDWTPRSLITLTVERFKVLISLQIGLKTPLTNSFLCCHFLLKLHQQKSIYFLADARRAKKQHALNLMRSFRQFGKKSNQDGLNTG